VKILYYFKILCCYFLVEEHTSTEKNTEAQQSAIRSIHSDLSDKIRNLEKEFMQQVTLRDGKLLVSLE